MADPMDRAIIAKLGFFTDYHIRAQIATMSAVHEALRQIVPNFQPEFSSIEKALRTKIGNLRPQRPEQKVARPRQQKLPRKQLHPLLQLSPKSLRWMKS